MLFLNEVKIKTKQPSSQPQPHSQHQPMYKDFTEMLVWQQAMDYAVRIFKLSANLPKQEDYALTSQIRRAALSISDNIAEGFGRETVKDKKHFYVIARGSTLETKNQLIYGTKAGYFEEVIVKELFKLQTQIHFELNKIIKTMRNS